MNQLHLPDYRLRGIITKYADHLSFPVMMQKPQEPSVDTDKADSSEDIVDAEIIEYEAVNQAQALWLRNKSNITEDEYNEFYKHVSHAYDNPLLHSHNQVEGKLEYTTLLYVPENAPLDLWNRDKGHGLKLYVQRVFIMDEVDQFLPAYLRFVKGIVDSKDLPLNVSREILQGSKIIDTIKKSVVKKVLTMLEKLAKNDQEKYAKFWTQFGEVLKEGPGEDFANREQIAKLIRFSTTKTDGDSNNVSFADYIANMQEGQDKIYYITADSYAAALSSPHLELFKKKDIEVILFSNRVDEWLVAQLTEVEGKQLQSVARGGVDLGDLDDKDEEQQQAVTEEFKGLIEKIKAELGEKIKDARISDRLTNSPACLVADDNDMGLQMQRIMQAAGQKMPEMKPIFELNPEHAIVKHMQAHCEDEGFANWANVIFDQAMLAEGGQLEDPAAYVNRLNQLLLQLT